MEVMNSLAELLVFLLPLALLVVVASCYVDDDAKSRDDMHDLILPREDWTAEEEAAFQAMCEEERRIRIEKLRQRAEERRKNRKTT